MRYSIDLANSILLERERRGLTQAQLADKAGVNRQWLNRLESGKGNPTLRSILTVLAALGLELAVVPAAPTAQEAQRDIDLEAFVDGFIDRDHHERR